MAGNTILIKTYTCAFAIGANRFVAVGSSDGAAALAGVGAKVIGISDAIGGGAPGTMQQANGGPVPGRVDVCKVGFASLVLGGTVTRGDLLKPDAAGAGVTAGTTGDIYGAIAEQSGVVGDIIDVFITLGVR